MRPHLKATKEDTKLSDYFKEEKDLNNGNN